MNVLSLTVATLIISGCTSATTAQDIQPIGQEIVPPFGYIGFCLRNAEDCQPSKNPLATVTLDKAKWHELNHVNEYVNQTIHPADDLSLHNRAEWWSYPSKNFGDCEDYALLKRKLLIERGWPANALLLSVVKRWDGVGHAVLLAVTHQGEYVLDNDNWKIEPWQDTPYLWIKRQSKHHPYVWVNLNANRQPKTPMTLTEPIPDELDKRNFPKMEPPGNQS
ncbi:MAG: transglutaminase-like cysteine peptidase [Parvibaculaceae bacterium]|nr:transglutaminase-like cysteine peptidase [Parvibaculaceae bacterium]